MKALLRLTAGFIALLIGLLFLLGWSQPGLRFITGTAAGLTGGNVSYRAVYGTLTSAWEVEQLKIHTSAVSITVGSLKADWRPLEIFAKRLHILSFTAQSVEVVFQESENGGEPQESWSGPIALPSLKLPVEVLLDDIRLENARLSSATFPEIAYVEHLYLSLLGKDEVFQLAGLNLMAKGYSADLTGTLDAREGWQVELGGDASFSGYGVGPLVGKLQVAGPLERLAAHVELDAPTRATVDGEITGLPNSFQWQAELEIEKFQLEDAHQILPEMMIGAKGPAHGDLKNYSGNLKGNMDYLFWENVDFQIELSGNYDQIVFPHVEAANDTGRAELVGGLLSWDDGLLWRGKLAVENFDPSQILEHYPGKIGLSLVSSGSYRSEDGLRLVGDFSDIAGDVRDFPLEGEGQIEIGESTIRLKDINFTSEDAEMHFEGMVRMAKGLDNPGQSLEWQADLRVEDVNPSLFFEEYPGDLSGHISSKGIRVEESLSGQIHLDEIEGVVRGYPVVGSGEVVLSPNRFDIDNVMLRSGTSELNITGSAGEQLDLSVELNSPDLSEFLVDLGGDMRLSGRVHGHRLKPDFTAELLGRKIRFQEFEVAQIDADLNGGLQAGSSLAGTVEASGIRTGLNGSPITIDTVKLDLDGEVEQHELTGLILAGESMGDFILSGGLDEDFQWFGELQRSRVDAPIIGSWGQRDGAPLAVSTSMADLDSFCMVNKGEQICLSAAWGEGDRSLLVELGWQGVDLARLGPFLQLSDSIWGKSTADFTLKVVDGKLQSGSGLLTLSKAGIGHRDEQTDEGWERTDLDNATVKMDLAEDTLLTTVDAKFADQSNLRLDSAVSNMGKISEGLAVLPLRGTVEADVRSLDFIAPLTDYRIRPTGSLKGDFSLTGTVANPDASGNLDLVNGVVDVPDLGISLQDVKFSVNGAEKGLWLTGQAKSGEGWLRAQGDIKVGAEGVEGDFSFIGDTFDAVMLPEYAIQASPDLRLKFTGDGGILSGELHIPSALIMPKNLKGAVNESSDVVFVNGKVEEKAVGWKLSTSVLLTMGDDVQLSGYGVSGNVVGKLKIESDPGLFMTGKGQLSLKNGVFSIYGRSLDLVRSRLLFSGGSIDNPGIDARAEKVVSDNDTAVDSVRVGVDVTGTVDDLEFVLFSDPPMDDTDILAYMVVGRSMSNTGQQDESLLSSVALALGLENSIGLVDRLTNLLPIDEMYIEGTTSEEMSLVVGKKLTDELYIGYDHNFFDQLGEWLLRYDLGKGFSVETRSSTEATGADILYSFER